MSIIEQENCQCDDCLKIKAYFLYVHERPTQEEDYDGRGQRTAYPMLSAIMSGGVGISGRELSTQLINSQEQANHSFS